MFHRLDSRQSPFRIRLKELRNKALCGIRTAFRDRVFANRNALKEFGERTGCCERSSTKKHLVGDAAEGPHIDFGGIRLACNDFGGQILGNEPK